LKHPPARTTIPGLVKSSQRAPDQAAPNANKKYFLPPRAKKNGPFGKFPLFKQSKFRPIRQEKTCLFGRPPKTTPPFPAPRPPPPGPSPPADPPAADVARRPPPVFKHFFGAVEAFFGNPYAEHFLGGPARPNKPCPPRVWGPFFSRPGKNPLRPAAQIAKPLPPPSPPRMFSAQKRIYLAFPNPAPRRPGPVGVGGFPPVFFFSAARKTFPKFPFPAVPPVPPRNLTTQPAVFK